MYYGMQSKEGGGEEGEAWEREEGRGVKHTRRMSGRGKGGRVI